MTTIQIMVEWALRSSILILSGALLRRVKDPAIRLAWTAVLCGSLESRGESLILESGLSKRVHTSVNAARMSACATILEPKKAAVEVFVVDHMERTPTGN